MGVRRNFSRGGQLGFSGGGDGLADEGEGAGGGVPPPAGGPGAGPRENF